MGGRKLTCRKAREGRKTHRGGRKTHREGRKTRRMSRRRSVGGQTQSPWTQQYLNNPADVAIMTQLYNQQQSDYQRMGGN